MVRLWKSYEISVSTATMIHASGQVADGGRGESEGIGIRATWRILKATEEAEATF